MASSSAQGFPEQSGPPVEQPAQQPVKRGGGAAAKWRAIAGLSVALISVISYFASRKPSITIGSHDQVYYSDGATKEQAQALGNALKTGGYFDDHGADVYLAKGKDGTVISFITKPEGWQQPANVSTFDELGREVASSVGGLPIQVRLTNDTHDVESESTVVKADFPGNDTVYCMGTVTQATAQTLGQALQSAHLFKGNGADVFLSKHKDGTVLSFVIGTDGWKDPDLVPNFEKIARQVAPAAGGLPLRLRLVDTSLEVKKDEMLQ